MKQYSTKSNRELIHLNLFDHFTSMISSFEQISIKIKNKYHVLNNGWSVSTFFDATVLRRKPNTNPMKVWTTTCFLHVSYQMDNHTQEFYLFNLSVCAKKIMELYDIHLFTVFVVHQKAPKLCKETSFLRNEFPQIEVANIIFLIFYDETHLPCLPFCIRTW